ncbi:MAG: FAD-dependent oxidoreductase [Lachnospiraceae bacterium]|nr:FAD-dependent oxidoreductase [Lachnospiraceae bacterium]
MKIIIIGGVAGGASAAARLRRLNEEADITIYERSGYMSYANCGLPYYIGGTIREQRALTLQTPKSFQMRFRVDVKVRHEVTKIDPAKKAVTVLDLENGTTFEDTYDKLILSPGAKPTRPDFPGIDNSKIFTLRTVEDAVTIHDYLEKESPRSAVVVGGGFIGLEIAENLKDLGLDVTIVELMDHLLNNLDRDLASFLHAGLRKAGLNLALKQEVAGFEDADKGIRVLLKDNEPLTADMVILAIGVTPESSLAKDAGLELGLKGSILVNDQMQTSDPDIYAVGDAVQIRQFVSGKDAVIPLAGPANKQGRLAADNICGLDRHYPGSTGSSVIKAFDMTVATTGLSEDAAKALGIPYERIILSPASHASYYPGDTTMNIKVVFEKESGKLLGAEIVGYDGVDKRIDVFATAITVGMTGSQLMDLDLAYAPPYSSAKDPVNMAGFMIDNIVRGIVKQFHWDEIDALPRDGSVILLDTRTPGEYERGCADQFFNIPVDELRDRLDEVEKGKPVYVMCQSGIRSYISCRILTQNGYDCYNFSGGYRFYESVTKEIAAAKASYPCGVEKEAE